MLQRAWSDTTRRVSLPSFVWESELKIEGEKRQGGRLVKAIVSSLPQGYPGVQQKQSTRSRALLPCRLHSAEHLRALRSVLSFIPHHYHYHLMSTLQLVIQNLLVFCWKPTLLLVPSITLRASSSTDPDGCTASAGQSSPTTAATAL